MSADTDTALTWGRDMPLPAFMQPQSLTDPLSLSRFSTAGEIMSDESLPGFPLDKQALPNWCWAAVAAGVDGILGKRRSQCEIAGDYATKTADPTVAAALQPPTCPPSLRVDTAGYLDEVLDFLGLSRTHFRRITAGDSTGEDARADIAMNLPVPVRISWSNSSGDGHFIALVGVDRQGGRDFIVYDPSESHEDVGQLLARSESELAASYDGIGKWSHIYPVKTLRS